MSEVTGGPLRDRFHFEQFHLHWGSTNDKGSEHTINGQLYAAEVRKMADFTQQNGLCVERASPVIDM